MAKASSIEQLPSDILQQLQQLLRDPRVSQLDATAQINAILESTGEPTRISKSAVNRYDLKMREVGTRLRQSREMAEMWIAKMGAAPQGQVGHLVNEILRTLSFELSMKITEGELDKNSMPEVIKMLQQLSLATMRLEKASSENTKREAEIRKQVAEENAEQLDAMAVEAGWSEQSVQAAKRKFLGLG